MRVNDQTLNYILKQSNEHSRACILNSIISKDAEIQHKSWQQHLMGV